MKEIVYTITDPEGIHARPAGILVKEAAKFSSKITIGKDGKDVDAKRILGVMGLGVKCGQEIVLKAEGEDEDTAIEALGTFLKETPVSYTHLAACRRKKCRIFWKHVIEK